MTSRLGLLITILDLGCAQHLAESSARLPAAPSPVEPACSRLPAPVHPQTTPAHPAIAPLDGKPSNGDQAADPAFTAHPAVTFVAAGGYWESGTASGTYRVIVKTHCGEHCAEEVLLEQVDESPPDGSIHRVVPVPETSTMRVESVNFWPSGKWNGEVEFRLTDDDGKQRALLCLDIAEGGKHESRSGPCRH